MVEATLLLLTVLAFVPLLESGDVCCCAPGYVQDEFGYCVSVSYPIFKDDVVAKTAKAFTRIPPGWPRGLKTKCPTTPKSKHKTGFIGIRLPYGLFSAFGGGWGTDGRGGGGWGGLDDKVHLYEKWGCADGEDYAPEVSEEDDDYEQQMVGIQIFSDGSYKDEDGKHHDKLPDNDPHSLYFKDEGNFGHMSARKKCAERGGVLAMFHDLRKLAYWQKKLKAKDLAHDVFIGGTRESAGVWTWEGTGERVDDSLTTDPTCDQPDGGFNWTRNNGRDCLRLKAPNFKVICSVCYFGSEDPEFPDDADTGFLCDQLDPSCTVRVDEYDYRKHGNFYGYSATDVRET